ncbi:MAG: CRTAC1 family protein [Acidobacteriota bacterium]|nr:CRTAC1 family protein [Acidobacteriota bacterium]
MGQPSPQPAFAERSEEWGLLFRHRHGGSGERYMVETMVGGVVLLDFDGDGDTDVVFVDGGRLPHYGGPTPRTRLFRNDNGLFVDWTERSGLDFSGYGCGGVAADVDGDGDEDLYLTAFGQDALFLNMGDGSFSRAVDSGGLSSASWSSSAAFADADRDGDLDLYVASYVQYSLSKRAFCGNEQRGIRGYCHPDVYPGAADRFYRNDGSGRFEDATQAAGLGQPSEAGLGVVFGDLNGDLAPDLFVANDLDPNLLFLNRGDGTFENWSLLSGTAYGDRGKAEAGMGVEMADFDADGRLDLFVTNFALETNALYRNLGDGLFTDARFVSRLAEPSHRLLGFGTGALDVDHDGDLDLVIANGHILDNPEELQSETNSYSMPNQLFVNDGSGVFAEVQQSGLDRVRPSRGLALGDLDLDGDQDLVIVNSNDRAEVYENRWGSARGAWLRVTLAGRGGNTAGIGARLTLRPSDKRFGSRTQTFEVRSGSSYLSRNELAIQFGVGSADTAQLTVVWPTAVTWLFEGLPTRRSVRLTESTVR